MPPHALVSLIFVLALSAAAAPPTPLIFDTDMGNDIDDALALAVIHALESRGEAKLIAVTITKDNRWSAPFVDLVNHFYHRPDIPIGVVRNGKTPQDAPYTRIPCERKTPDGKPLYPRRIQDGSQAPEAAGLIKSVLEKQPDHSVVIAQVGFSTNLARLLDLPGATDLVRRKVKLLSVMAGQFPSGKPEYNVHTDVESARKLFSSWPTAIVFSGFEIGLSIPYPARAIENDFRWVPNHPIVDAYRAYKPMPYDRPTWDLTAVLYALRPDSGYFSLSRPGTVNVGSEGRTTLQSSPNGLHRYLTVTPEQRAKTLEALIELSSQPRNP
ncbi:MAG: nucleoside hydrolase [Bryobacterales bacterium]|nr:nucleoside hydrolase [Bryobacterales bacterium]